MAFSFYAIAPLLYPFSVETIVDGVGRSVGVGHNRSSFIFDDITLVDRQVC